MTVAPQPQPGDQPSQPPHKAFFTTLPGILTGAAGTLGTILALVTALNEAPWLHRDVVTSTPTGVVAQAVISTPHPESVSAQVPVNTQSAAPPSVLTLSDDFSNTTSGWEIQADGDLWSVGYLEGQYRVYSAGGSDAILGGPVRIYDVADLILEVDAQQISGPEDGTYGVALRERDDTTFYYFAVASDRTYAILRSDEDAWVPLFDWIESTVVRPLGEVNHFAVECVGSTLRFALNGIPLAEVTDGAYLSGNFGFVVSATDVDAMDVRFDNVRVQPPTVR
jgi:hypothetical protein